jgi:hypothetical protein
MFVTIIAAVLVAMSPIGTGATTPNPIQLGAGGPDAYGYTYIDSDTTAPGAPTYNWIELKGVGTQVTGLGDDNVVGPFSIGFSFPYYWYEATQVFIGSNGYITFGDNAMNASPFQHIPAPARSNNTLAVLMSDLDLSTSGAPNSTVWYWTNATADTFIVEYDSCAFWSTGGNNTFQVILSRPDSSITFQYKEQSGAPYNGWAPDDNQTGIENVSGAVGLSYLSGTIPPSNMYAPNLAVKFVPPDSTSYIVHDVGVNYALNGNSGGVFVPNTRPMTLWGVVKNFGNQTEAPFMSYVKVLRQAGTQVFIDSISTTGLAPGAMESLDFLPWTPSANGVYVTKVYTKMAGDMMIPNDTVRIETRVITLPATLQYCADSSVSFMYWNGPGGFGNFFIPPVLPCSVTGIRVYAQSAAGVNCDLALYDDDGNGGGPGTTLYTGTVNVTAAGWYQLMLPTPSVFEDGGFFVGATSTTSSDPSFGMDSIPPLSFQSWEYTGVWAPSRDGAVRDAMTAAMVTGQVGVSEWTNPTPAPVSVRIDATPNPFGTFATLRLLNPRGGEKAIEVFDATGSVVRSLSLTDGRAALDGRKLADGIYFARVAGSESPVAKLIVSH